MIVTVSDFATFSLVGGVLTISSGSALPVELNPDPIFALGYTGWEPGSVDGSIELDTNAFIFTACGDGDRLFAVDDNKHAFLDNLADSTAYTVRVTVTDYVAGLPTCILKGGTPVQLLDVDGGATFEAVVTSGTVAEPVKLRGTTGSEFSGKITSLSVQAA